MTSNTEARLEKLELLFMEQEQMLEALSHQFDLQQQEMRQVMLQLEQMKERVKSMSASLVATQAEETPPPHY